MDACANPPPPEKPKPTYCLLRDRHLAFAAGVLLVAAALLIWATAAPQRFTAVFDSLTAVDVEQARLDQAFPAPRGAQLISQSFRARHAGLSEIEVTLLRYGENPVADEREQLTLQLLDERGTLVAEKVLATAAVTHNQVERLTFGPLPDSRGQTYVLRLSGSVDNPVSVWGYSIDAYAGGAAVVSGGEQAAGPPELRFTTRYTLGWAESLLALGTAVYYEGALLALALILLPLPGVWALYAYRRLALRGGVHDGALLWDPAAWWGAALALGAAVWPLIWLWATTLGLRWSAWSLWALLLLGWAGAAWLWLRERRTGGIGLARPWRVRHALLLVILGLGLAARLVAVRDLSFLPWVDASRHALITAVMIQNGQVIRDYAPFLPVDHFPYHFGFHTLSASLGLMSGWPLERLLLYLGQLLNGLVPLTIFAATWLLARRQSAALLAAFLVALPFFFPAYYTTWGRMTQLTAVLVLPVLLAFTWELARGQQSWRLVWWLVAALAAGLFLIHVRVFAYYLPFALLAWLFNRLRGTRWLALAGGLALLLVLPHLLHLLDGVNPQRPLGGTIPDYNVFPVSYITTGWETYFLVAAGLGLLPLLAGAWRRERWVALPFALLAWAALLLGLLSLDRLGLPLPSLFNLNSMVIILFVPLAIYLGAIASRLWAWLGRAARPWSSLGYGASGALLAAALLFGLRQQAMIINEQTILARLEDVPALDWLAENLPPEATVGVNSWRWLGETWAAADGGAWILPLTARNVTTPPIDHIYNADLFSEVRAFNEAATAVADWSDPAQAVWLREQGVTHIYAGKRGGFFDPAKLHANTGLEMIYNADGVFIFALRP